MSFVWRLDGGRIYREEERNGKRKERKITANE